MSVLERRETWQPTQSLSSIAPLSLQIPSRSSEQLTSHAEGELTPGLTKRMLEMARQRKKAGRHVLVSVPKPEKPKESRGVLGFVTEVVGGLLRSSSSTGNIHACSGNTNTTRATVKVLRLSEPQQPFIYSKPFEDFSRVDSEPLSSTSTRTGSTPQNDFEIVSSMVDEYRLQKRCTFKHTSL